MTTFVVVVLFWHKPTQPFHNQLSRHGIYVNMSSSLGNSKQTKKRPKSSNTGPDVDDDGIDPQLKKLLDPKRVLQILEWRRKILLFVETMMEEDISLDQLQAGESLICQRDYDCIVQERYLSQLCGYPICSNRLTKVWKQRYHVSLRDKRVYDVDVRKLYCSVKCMDASLSYKEKNLAEEPIWMQVQNLKLDTNFEIRPSNP